MNKKALKKKIIAARIYPSKEVMAICAEELEKLAEPKLIRQWVAKLDTMNPAQIAALMKKAEKEDGEATSTEAKTVTKTEEGKGGTGGEGQPLASQNPVVNPPGETPALGGTPAAEIPAAGKPGEVPAGETTVEIPAAETPAGEQPGDDSDKPADKAQGENTPGGHRPAKRRQS